MNEIFAAVDYGSSTGLVIAHVQNYGLEILMRCYFIETISCKNPQGIAAIMKTIKKFNCSIIILEKLPSNSRNETARAIYDQILFESNRMRAAKTALVSPGLWKPFMKKHSIDLSAWSPQTVHERDAMRMLWYTVYIHSGSEGIVLCEQKEK